METGPRHIKKIKKAQVSQTFRDANLRRTYQTIGEQGYGDDVNPFSRNSRFPYAVLRKTGKNIPHMLALMRNDPEIIHQQKRQQVIQMKYFKRFSYEMRAALDKREKDEEKIRAHRTTMAKQIILPPFPDITPLNI